MSAEINTFVKIMKTYDNIVFFGGAGVLPNWKL